MVEGLADGFAEIQPDVQPDVGSGEAFAAQVGTGAEQAVEPLQAVPGHPLQAVGRLGRDRDARFEAGQSLGIVVRVVDEFRDVEFDPTPPLPAGLWAS